MNLSNLPKNLPIPKNDGKCQHLYNLKIPSISLPNQDGNLLELNRHDTFRLIIFCFPSFAEGFGLPVLEAMASGLPVIVSNTSSLPEICQDAGLYINPLDYRKIAEIVNELASDNHKYNHFKGRSLKQAEKFKWDIFTKKIIDVCLDV